MASLAMASPARFRPQRSPARPSSAGVSWARMERTRASRPVGLTMTRSPTFTVPESTVPVTTVPAPARVKERSTARRNRPSAARSGACRAASTRWARTASTPWPVTAETGTMGAPSRLVPVSAASIWADTSARRSSSTRSHLVRAIRPRWRPKRSRMARCSRVCGIRPSSAATTSSTKSMPVAPASMVCTKRSWPGTSMKPSVPTPSTGR